MNVKIKKLHPNAIIPSYANPGDACFDISTVEPGFVSCTQKHVFGTGLAFQVPEGHVMLVFSRSGHGFKDDIRLSNCVGVIDSGYRGELKVKMTKDAYYGASGKFFAAGDRIAQGMILPVEAVNFDVVDELDDTVRGTGGFGSTGEKNV